MWSRARQRHVRNRTRHGLCDAPIVTTGRRSPDSDRTGCTAGVVPSRDNSRSDALDNCVRVRGSGTTEATFRSWRMRHCVPLDGRGWCAGEGGRHASGRRLVGNVLECLWRCRPPGSVPRSNERSSQGAGESFRGLGRHAIRSRLGGSDVGAGTNRGVRKYRIPKQPMVSASRSGSDDRPVRHFLEHRYPSRSRGRSGRVGSHRQGRFRRPGHSQYDYESIQRAAAVLICPVPGDRL